MNKSNISQLESTARELRGEIVRNSSLNKIPHLGSCLSVLDILVYLYFFKTSLKKSSFKTHKRDKIILSKGHAAPALFWVLNKKKLLNFDLEKEYKKISSFVGEHPPIPAEINAIEAATGSLGHGFSMSIGMALSNKINNYENSIYTVLGDGELNEGVIWEGAMFASKNRLNNLTIFVDFNKWQATGRSEDILDISNLVKRWCSFGWDAIDIDGHCFSALDSAVNHFKKSQKPKIIICNTIKGKGVSFMEDDNNWHYRTPNKSELDQALKELEVSF